MNKKLVTLGSSLMLGGVMFFTTAFATFAGDSGYDAYKSALKNTMSVKNFVANAEVQIKDNGNEIFNVSSTGRFDEQNHAMSSSTTMRAKGIEHSINTYTEDGKTIVKASKEDTYYVIEEEGSKRSQYLEEREDCEDEQVLRAGEMIIDSLVGDLKNYVTLDAEKEGTKEITMNLSGSQIPTVVNTLAGLAIKNASVEQQDHHEKYSPVEFDFDIQPPKLVEDIRIDEVDLKAFINKENLIEKQEASMIVSGRDAEGQIHEVSIQLKITLTDFDSAQPNPIDLTGKEVKVIDPKEFDRHE